MMEPVRFADILFILLVCVVTFGILALVNRKRTVPKKESSAATAVAENNQPDSPTETINKDTE